MRLHDLLVQHCTCFVQQDLAHVLLATRLAFQLLQLGNNDVLLGALDAQIQHGLDHEHAHLLGASLHLLGKRQAIGHRLTGAHVQVEDTMKLAVKDFQVLRSLQPHSHTKPWTPGPFADL